MRKILFLISSAAALFLIGCSSKNNDNLKPSTCIIENQKAPTWICAPQDTNKYITAVGSAEKTPLGFSFQQTEALSAARDALARRISVKVKNIFKRYEATTGVKQGLTAEKVVKNVSKQLANVTLRDSKIITSWQSKKGTLYVLVGMPKKNIEEAIKNSIFSKKALYQKYIANQEWEKLDKAIKEEFGE